MKTVRYLCQVIPVIERMASEVYKTLFPLQRLLSMGVYQNKGSELAVDVAEGKCSSIGMGVADG